MKKLIACGLCCLAFSQPLYERYALHLINNRFGADSYTFELMMKNHDGALDFYEAIAKGLYLFEYGDKQKGIEILNSVYNRAKPLLDNSFDGLMIEAALNKGDIISSHAFCFVLRGENRALCYDILGKEHYEKK